MILMIFNCIPFLWHKGTYRFILNYGNYVLATKFIQLETLTRANSVLVCIYLERQSLLMSKVGSTAAADGAGGAVRPSRRAMFSTWACAKQLLSFLCA
jgi:hypothetical protein